MKNDEKQHGAFTNATLEKGDISARQIYFNDFYESKIEFFCEFFLLYNFTTSFKKLAHFKK